MMPRIKGWERALLSEIERHAAMPFSWAESNCVYFPCDCVRAMTGHDPSQSERGCESKQDFTRRLVKLKCKNVGDFLALHLPEIETAFMGRGDLAIVEQEDYTPGVVCIGSYLIGKTEDGMIHIPRSMVLRAFRVG